MMRDFLIQIAPALWCVMFGGLLAAMFILGGN